MTWMLVDPEAKPDEMAERVNWRMLQRHITPRGFRAPLGESYGFQNDSMKGAGLHGVGSAEVKLVSDRTTVKAASSQQGAVLELSPNGAPEADVVKSRIVLSEIDTADNDTKTQLVIEADGSVYAIKSLAEIGGELRDIVWGTEENGNFIESMRLTTTGELGIGTDGAPDEMLHVAGNILADGDLVLKSDDEFTGNIGPTTLTDHRTYTLPDKSGTFAMLDDIPEGSGILTTEGDLLTHDGSTEVRLPIGTSGKVLTSNGAGNQPSWETPSAGSTDLVYVGTPANFDVSEVTDVQIVSRAVTSVGSTDQLIVEGWCTILNDSAATRAYTFTLDFNGLFDVEITTGILSASAADEHPIYFAGTLSIRSTSLSYATFELRYGTNTAKAAGADPGVSSATFSETGWNTHATDVSGTTTVTLHVRSTNANATQTLRLHHFTIRKVTPT